MTEKKQPTVIGLTGKKSAGKSTIANLIGKYIPSEQYGFAQPLKAAAHAMFGWSLADMERFEFKETVDPFWGFKPRLALQLLGTEFGRQGLREDIWLLAAEKRFKENQEKGIMTIFTDVRFDNEAEFVRKIPGAVLVHVIDPNNHMLAADTHASEAGVEFKKGDIELLNLKVGPDENGKTGLDKLEEDIKALFV